VAVKLFTHYRGRKYFLEEFELEKNNMVKINRLDHSERIVPLLSSFEVKEAEICYAGLILPFANGGTLYDLLHAKGLPFWLLDHHHAEHWNWNLQRNRLVHCTDNPTQIWCEPGHHAVHDDLSMDWTSDSVQTPQSQLDQDNVGRLQSYLLLEMSGLLQALASLHSKRREIYAIHRDIKPANILIIDGKLKFADFGLSRVKDSMENSTTEWVGGKPIF
jgi:serine/threonine protein kinase